MGKSKLLFITHEMSPFLELTKIAEITRQLPQAMQDKGYEILGTRSAATGGGIVSIRKSGLDTGAAVVNLRKNGIIVASRAGWMHNAISQTRARQVLPCARPGVKPPPTPTLAPVPSATRSLF